MNRDAIFAEIAIERERQDRIWGGPKHDAIHTSHDWIAYLTKHVGKAVHWPWTPEIFKRQMIVVAALAIASIEWLDLPSSTGGKPDHDH